MLLMIMFVTFILLLFCGMPIAFSMLSSSILYIILNGTPPLVYVAQKITSSLISFPLLAIPFFILAGNLMNELDVSGKIFEFARSLVGHIRGGLAHVNVLASLIFAGMSGSSMADVGGLGAIEIKAMNEANYPKSFSAAITAASSAIGPVVPPSVMLVLYGVMAGVSIGRLFIAGILPGVLMTLSLMFIIGVDAKKRNLPKEGSFQISRVTKSFKDGYLALSAPILLLVFLILGVATPTELGIMLVVYVLLIGIVYKTFKIKNLCDSISRSAILITQVLFLVACASIFGSIMIRENVPSLLMSYLEKFPVMNGPVFLMLMVVVLLILGCFIEGLAIETMMIPIVVPIAKNLGIDLVQLGVIMVIAIEIGLITPPMGMSVYIASDIAGCNVEDTFKESIKFILPLLATLLIMILFPAVVLFLPELMFG